MPLRILLDLTPEAADGSDSVTIHLIQFAEYLASQGHFIYIATPSHIGAKPNRLISRQWFPRSLVVPTAPIPGGNTQYRKTSPDLVTILHKFSPTNQVPLYLVDGVLGAMGTSTPAIAVALSPLAQEPVAHVMFEDCSGALYPGDTLLQPYNNNFVLTSAATMVQKTAYLAYLTRYERDFGLASFRQKGFSPAHVIDMEKRTFITGIPWGDALTKQRNLPRVKNKKFTFCFGGTLNNEGTKRSTRVIAAYAAAAKTVGGRIVLTNTDTSKAPALLAAIKAARDIGVEVELIDNCSKTEFLEVLSTTHVFVNWSSSETYGLAVREAALLDNVLLSVHTEATRATFPEIDTQTWLFSDNHNEAVAALVDVANNYPERLKEQQPLRDRFEALVSNGQKQLQDNLYAGLKFHIDGRNKNFFGPMNTDAWVSRSGNAPEALGEFIDQHKGSTFTLYEALTAVASVFEVSPEHYIQACPTLNMPDAYQLRNLLLYMLKLRDPCDSRVLKFEA